ncbi:MAG: IBR domain-containing protein [Sedimenticola sp.]
MIRSRARIGLATFDYNALGENDVSADGVPFSLNKKRRWEIPGLLKSQILHGDFKHEEFGVQLIERHTLLGLKNAISICASKLPGAKSGNNKPKEIIKRKGYLNVKCVMNNKPPRARRRRYQRPAPEEEPAPPTDQVIYDFMYPVPASSSHNPKRFGYDTRDPNYDTREMSKTRHCRRQRFRRRCADMIGESLRLLADGGYDDSEEEDPVFEEAGPVVRETTVILEDILRHSTKVQELCHRGKRNKSSSSSNEKTDNGLMWEKKHIVYVAKHDDAHRAEHPKPKTAYVTTAEPVHLLLKNEEVDPYNLKTIYGQDYVECECFPRKFILDISTGVSNLECLKYDGALLAEKTAALLVFTHDVDNEVNNEKENMYNVILKMKFHPSMEVVKIDTLFDYTEYNVTDIIKNTLFFIETLPSDVVLKSRKPYDVTQCNTDGALGNCANWKCAAHLPTERYLYETYVNAEAGGLADELGFEVVSRMDAYSREDKSDIFSPKNRLCYICYSELATGEAATALMACGHWFCDICWREHLTTSINAGAIKLLCPEYDCSRTVDRGTLLSLVNIEKVIKHVKCCHDTLVEQQDVMKWCPAPSCGRVVEVNSVDVMNAQCACKNKFCFKCLKNTHWPAPCDVMPKYAKKLYHSQATAILPEDFNNYFTVNGKNCPHCKRFVEKNGGCSYMSCMCGNSFCWGCGRPYTLDHSEHTNCSSLDKHGTEERTFVSNTQSSRRRRKWYKLALHHRAQQHPLKLQKLKSTLRSVSVLMRAHLTKAELRGDPVCLEFQGHANRTYNREADKVNDFLKHMVGLFTEMNEIAEHVGVLLDCGNMAGQDYLPFPRIAARLGAFAACIYDVFTVEAEHDPKQALLRLQEIHLRSNRCIAGLVRCVKRISL